jgi:hypothetical protein
VGKKLIVPIVADSAAFKKGLKESEHAARQFEEKIKGSVSHVRGHLLGMGAALVGVGGLVEGLKLSVEAGEKLAVSTRALNAQLKANGENVKAVHPQVELLNSKMAKLGITSDQTEQAFTRLDRSSGSAAAAQKYMGLTADLAAAKHIDLSQAAFIVGKVISGNVGILNRQGIAIAKGTSSTEALAIAQKKLAGQAAAAVTPSQRFHAVLTNIEAAIGEKLLPTIEKYLNKLSDWFSKADNQRKITDAVTSAVKGLTQIIQTVVPWIEKGWRAAQSFSDAMGGFKNTVLVLTAAFAGYKVGLVAVSFAQTVMGATGVGALTAIKGALISTGIGAAFVGLGLAAGYVITHWDKVKGWFGTFWGWLKTGWRDALDLVKGLFYGWVAAVIGELKLLADGAAKALGWLPGIGGKLKEAAKTIDGWYSDFSTKSKNAFADIGSTSANSFANSYISTMTAQQAAMAAAAGGGGTAAGATADARGQSGAGGATRAGSYGPDQVRALLLSQGATPAEAAYLTYASTHHEDPSGNPRALNDNPSTHDYSVGLFQINFRNMQNQWMRGGQPAAAKLAQDPAAQARYALSLLHSQGPGAWPTSAGMASSFGLGGGGGGGFGGALPGDALAADKAAKAATRAEKAREAAAKAAASAAYKAWKQNYFTPLDNQYKSDLLITDESKRLLKLQALHAKLAIDLKSATGKEHQDILDEENKVQAKIQSLKAKQHNAAVALIAKEKAAYIASLQAQQTALTSQMSKAQAELAKQQMLFDRAWQRIADKVTGTFNDATQAGLDAINARYGAKTPEEQAAAAFQAQLDAAQRATDLAGARTALSDAQAGGDPSAIRAAQAALDNVRNSQKLSDLQDAAAKSRVIADKAAAAETQTYQDARKAQLQNLNDWLADQKSGLEAGSVTWDQFWSAAFSDAPAKYAPNAVSSLQGVIAQMQVIRGIQSDIDANSAALANAKGTGNRFGSLDPAIATAMATAMGVHGAGSASSARGNASGSAIPMAKGGSGTVTRPTWFLAGEAGREDFAFSGAGKSFGGGSAGQTVEVHLHVGPVYGAIDQATARQWAAPLKAEIDRVIKI